MFLANLGHISIYKSNHKKPKWCDWDSNPGPREMKDVRRRQIHNWRHFDTYAAHVGKVSKKKQIMEMMITKEEDWGDFWAAAAEGHHHHIWMENYDLLKVDEVNCQSEQVNDTYDDDDGFSESNMN